MTWRATRTILRDGHRYEAGDAIGLGADPQDREALERIGAVEWVEDAPDPVPATPAPAEAESTDEPVEPAAPTARPKRGRTGA